MIILQLAVDRLSQPAFSVYGICAIGEEHDRDKIHIIIPNNMIVADCIMGIYENNINNVLCVISEDHL